MKKQSNKTEGNIYDRIFKENAEHLFIPLVEQHLNKKIKSYKLLPEKLPKTIEREIDSLYEIVLENGKQELLHLEYQTKDDKSMIFRMGIYHGLAFSKYKKPISHVVIYLGKGKSKMRNQLKKEEIFSGFDLISLNTIDSNKLLQSQIPEILLLSVLGKFEKEQTEDILRSILKKLKKVSSSKKELSKFHQQLIILARMRKLDDETIKIIDDMPIEYDIEKDYLYNKGVAKTKDVIKLYNKGISVKEIAKQTGYKISFIKGVIEDVFDIRL